MSKIINMRMIDEADFDYKKYGFKEIEKEFGIVISKLNITKENEDFKKGSYRIVSCHDLFILPSSKEKLVLDNLCEQFNALLKILKVKPTDNIIVCGLGNSEIVSDSLGAKCCSKILATRLLDKKIAKSSIASLCPNVQALTGINTYDIVNGIAKQINAKLIILIDSFLTNNFHRLGHSFQFSTCGIIPGGAFRDNKEISYETTSIKCLTIGVPLMLDLKTIDKNINKSVIVSPKDIKYMVNVCSQYIADTINSTLNKDLSLKEIKELIKPY